MAALNMWRGCSKFHRRWKVPVVQALGRHHWSAAQPLMPLTEATVPHVKVPSAFGDHLQRLLLPIAASLHAQWTALGNESFSSLADRPLQSALASGTGPKRSVSFADGQTVDVQFYSTDEPLATAPLHETTAGMKYFDGPSGHKMGRSVREGDPDDWDEITRLLAKPRWAVCWSHTW